MRHDSLASAGIAGLAIEAIVGDGSPFKTVEVCMPSNLPPRRPRRTVRMPHRYLPYIMISILCAIIVIVGTKPRPAQGPELNPTAGTPPSGSAHP